MLLMLALKSIWASAAVLSAARIGDYDAIKSYYQALTFGVAQIVDFMPDILNASIRRAHPLEIENMCKKLKVWLGAWSDYVVKAEKHFHFRCSKQWP